MHDLALVIHLLFGDRVSAERLLVSVQVYLRFVQHGLVVRQLPLGFGQRGLIRLWVDLQQRIALMHHLPFDVVHLHDLALHATRHRYRIYRSHGAQGFDVHSNIARGRNLSDHRHRLRMLEISGLLR